MQILRTKYPAKMVNATVLYQKTGGVNKLGNLGLVVNVTGDPSQF